jgi:hypothetical protein
MTTRQILSRAILIFVERIPETLLAVAVIIAATNVSRLAPAALAAGLGAAMMLAKRK